MRKKLAYPQVTVVIPTYNRAAELDRCLNSLLSQTLDNFEVLVCDDGSTDSSSDVAHEYVDRLDLTYDTDVNFGGPAKPRNRGIAMARAKYVAFLDSDDWWAPTKLEQSVDALDAGADLIYHDLQIARKSETRSQGTRLVSSNPIHPMFAGLLCNIISIPNSSVVVRRTLMRQIGGISESRDLISGEDFDTWIRISQLTEKFVRIPQCLGYYWVGDNNISTCSPRQIELIKAIYKQYLPDLPSAERAKANGMMAYRIGKIALRLDDMALARRYLVAALRNPTNSLDRIKAGYLMTQTFLPRALGVY